MHGGIFTQLNILVDHTYLYRGMSYSDAAKWELVGSVKACFIFIDILIQQNSFLIMKVEFCVSTVVNIMMKEAVIYNFKQQQVQWN